MFNQKAFVSLHKVFIWVNKTGTYNLSRFFIDINSLALFTVNDFISKSVQNDQLNINQTLNMCKSRQVFITKSYHSMQHWNKINQNVNIYNTKVDIFLFFMKSLLLPL